MLAFFAKQKWCVWEMEWIIYLTKNKTCDLKKKKVQIEYKITGQHMLKNLYILDKKILKHYERFAGDKKECKLEDISSCLIIWQY